MQTFMHSPQFTQRLRKSGSGARAGRADEGGSGCVRLEGGRRAEERRPRTAPRRPPRARCRRPRSSGPRAAAGPTEAEPTASRRADVRQFQQAMHSAASHAPARRGGRPLAASSQSAARVQPSLRAAEERDHRAHEPEERAEGAEVAAPEARLDEVRARAPRGRGGPMNAPCGSAAARRSGMVRLSKGIDDVEDGAQRAGGPRSYAAPIASVHREVGRRDDAEGERAHQEARGVEEPAAGERDAATRRGARREQVVLDAEPCRARRSRLAAISRAAPTTLLSVPSGQTQPQKTRPRSAVTARSESESRKSPRSTCAAESVARPRSGSKSRKSLTG